MLPGAISKYLLLTLLLFIASVTATAQTQDDFNNKLTDVYTNSADPKKALAIAKELYNMVEKKKELQTYTNYYLLKNLFENTTPDVTLAKTTGEKADKLMRDQVGLENPKANYGNDTMNQWYNIIYPQLFETKDPENASKALLFLDKNPSYKNYTNYTFIAYAFERNGNFTKAKEYYEHALTLTGNDKEEYVSYLYYALFLCRYGDYLKAEEFIHKIDKLSEQANEMLRASYRSEALTAKMMYYFYIGDFQSYVQYSDQQNAELSKVYSANKLQCGPYDWIHYTNTAYASELLRDYNKAERLWKSRDSSYNAWIACQKKQYPNLKIYPLSMWPVYLLKRGKRSKLPQPASYFIKETETYYSNFSKMADISTNFGMASQLAALGSPSYPAIFKPILEGIRTTHDFRESTKPFSEYAYYSMRDRNWEESKQTYNELFALNAGWINDIIFTFGEKAFVTYYNSKLKEGYENFHSFVKVCKEKHSILLPQVSIQAYNNLLFTKSISLQGTKRRKDAFLNVNDKAVTALYENWIDKKQQLIRQYFKTSEPGSADTSGYTNKEALKKLQDEVNQLENELVVKAKDFRKYLKITPPDWKEVREKLKEGEAAVEMIRFQWRDQVYYSDTSYYAAYIITKISQFPEVVYLPDAATDLDDKYYKTYKSNIRFKMDDNDSYNHYWKAISEKLAGIKKVYFSPDGIYNLVNISTLKNPVSKLYILDEMEIQSTTSTNDIAMTGTIEKEIKTAVLFGRPTYKTATAIAAAPLPDEITRSLVSSFRDGDIADLPGTEEEVMSIKNEMDKKKIGVTYYLREQATEEKMYQLHSPGILHIATHGYWSGAGENATDGYRIFNAMVNSGLLLTGVVNYYSNDDYPNTYDGILTAYEAQNLDLQNTSLVILSACETTLGYLDAGEGVYGLQRAFRAAGAGSVMTSLWKVDDKATRDFMIAFYQQYLTTKDKHAAFVFAQKLIKEKYASPYYWGAFVMVGE